MTQPSCYHSSATYWTLVSTADNRVLPQLRVNIPHHFKVGQFIIAVSLIYLWKLCWWNFTHFH